MPPAARVTDMHVCPMVTVLVPHVGGPILPPGVPTVLIGFLPAATVTDMLTCVGPPDIIVKGSAGVFINFLPAARMGDMTAHGGVIILGEPTVIIGEIGSPSPGAGGMGAIAAGLVASGITGPANTQSLTALLSTPCAGLTPVAVLPGTNGKTAVIGRSMGTPESPGVTAYSAGLAKTTPKVETFSGDKISKEALDEFKEVADIAKKEFEAGRRADKYLTPTEIKTTKLYAENVAWAQKLKSEGYTVVDLGNPKGLPESAFYNCEHEALASPDWVKAP